MQKRIKLMTDSACDITKEQEAEYDIKVLSFPVTVGDDSYLERVDFTNDEFYDILISAPKIPVTSQITMIQFENEYNEIMSDGYDELIYVSINKTGSSTNGNAVMARDNFYEKHPEAKESFKIHIVDSKTYCMAYGYPVIEAAKKVRRGASSNEILAYLKDWFNSVEIYFAPYTLEFVKKSGRVTAAAAFVGELVGLRPIISIIDGETKVVEKVRGDKAVIPALIKHAKKQAIPHTPYIVVHGKCTDRGEELFIKAEKEMGCEAEDLSQIGAAVSINTGPIIVGIIVKGKNRSNG